MYLRDGSAQTILRAATLRQKLQIKLSTSPSHSILTPGRPVPVLTPKKSRRKRNWNPGSSALEADALPLGQRGDEQRRLVCVLQRGDRCPTVCFTDDLKTFCAFEERLLSLCLVAWRLFNEFSSVQGRLASRLLIEKPQLKRHETE